MKDKLCDECKQETSRKELGRAIKGRYLCKECKRDLRKKHRKETIEITGVKKELLDIGRDERREYARKQYAKARGGEVRIYRREGMPAIPKGSILPKIKKDGSCYLKFNERQSLLRILMSKGMDFEEAKERIEVLVQSQKDLRKKLRQEEVPEEDIQSQQKEMLEELWNS